MNSALLDRLSVSEALAWTFQRFRSVGFESCRLEASILLEYVLSQTRAWVLAHPEYRLTDQEALELQQLTERRLAGEPLAYLVHHREFFGLDLYVDFRVLIPRPETELLVERAIDIARWRGSSTTIVDVGTGSGAIALALAQSLPGARILAVDRSEDALKIARLNSVRLGIHEPQFIHGDLIAWMNEPADLIVANLPYISSDRMVTLPIDVRDHEPHEALDGGEAGLELMIKLIEQAASRLAPNGTLLLECDPEQMSPLTVTAQTVMPSCGVHRFQDSFGHDRVLEIRP